MLGKDLWLKTTPLYVFCLHLVKSLRSLQIRGILADAIAMALNVSGANGSVTLDTSMDCDKV